MVNIRIKDKSRFSFLAKYIGGIMDLTATDLLAIEKDNADHLLDKGRTTMVKDNTLRQLSTTD